MKNALLLLCLTFALLPLNGSVAAPEAPAAHDTAATELSSIRIRGPFLKAVREARKKGDISVRDAVKLRVASFSPAFMNKVQTLAVTQMAFSGEDGFELPMTETGAVDVDGIDWDGLILFIEKLLPLILQLISAFGI